MQNSNLKKWLISVNLLAIAIAIDVITGIIPGLNLSMPMGGKFFGISMLPLILIGLLFGLKYGLVSTFVFAIYNFTADYIVYLSTLNAVLESWTGTPWSFLEITYLVLFDYIIPFTAFGLTGLFKNGLSSIRSFIYSVLIISFIRLVSSTISGTILWGSFIKYAYNEVSLGNEEATIATRIFANVNHNLFLYSLIYNFIYITTTAIVVILIGISIFNRLKILKEIYVNKADASLQYPNNQV